MNEEDKILKGELFCPSDPELKAMKLRSHDLSAQYSRTSESETELRSRLAREILEGHIHKDSAIQVDATPDGILIRQK